MRIVKLIIHNVKLFFQSVIRKGNHGGIAPTDIGYGRGNPPVVALKLA